MADLHFKKLDVDNWLSQDEAMKPFVSFVGGKILSIGGNDWARIVLEPQLTLKVPNDVIELFEVARSTLVYAYFFYPLWTLGMEQMCRVLEAAVTHRCKALVSPALKNFHRKVDWLISRSAIPSDQAENWHRFVELRNFVSHPEKQSILLPGMVVGNLQTSVELINLLFDGG